MIPVPEEIPHLDTRPEILYNKPIITAILDPRSILLREKFYTREYLPLEKPLKDVLQYFNGHDNWYETYYFLPTRYNENTHQSQLNTIMTRSGLTEFVENLPSTEFPDENIAVVKDSIVVKTVEVEPVAVEKPLKIEPENLKLTEEETILTEAVTEDANGASVSTEIPLASLSTAIQKEISESGNVLAFVLRKNPFVI